MLAAININAPTETSAAFFQRLKGIRPERWHAIVQKGQRFLDRPSLRHNSDKTTPTIFVVSGPQGQLPGELVDVLGDRAAVHGTTVLRLSLNNAADAEKELAAIAPLVDVLQRKNMIRPGPSQHAAGDPGDVRAHAATALTRLNEKVLLCIENLHLAAPELLQVLLAAFEGAANKNLRIVASIDTQSLNANSEHMQRFLDSEWISESHLPALSVEETGKWLENAVGIGVLDIPEVTELHGQSRGTIAGLMAGLRDRFANGQIIRQTLGYRSSEVQASDNAESKDGGEIEAAVACMTHALPAGLVQSYLAEFQRGVPELMADGTLLATEGDTLKVADEASRAARYRRIPAQFRMQQHHKLARKRIGRPWVLVP